jgi:hypothetical protein
MVARSVALKGQYSKSRSIWPEPQSILPNIYCNLFIVWSKTGLRFRLDVLFRFRTAFAGAKG